MNYIKTEQIIVYQINLIKSQGPSLATYSQIHQRTSFQGASQAAKQPTKLLLAQCIKSVGADSNANLKAFIIVILKLVYEKKIKYEIIQKLKRCLYSKELDLTMIKGHIHPQLNNIQMKKLLVQFFQLLNYGKEDYKVENRLIKYPIVLSLLVMYLKTILKMNSIQINDYNHQIETSLAFSFLSDFFQITCSNFLGIYLFPDDGYFISSHNRQQYVYGSFFQSQVQYKNKLLSPSKIDTIQENQIKYQQNNIQISNQLSNNQNLIQSKLKAPKISFGISQQNYFIIQKIPHQSKKPMLIINQDDEQILSKQQNFLEKIGTNDVNQKISKKIPLKNNKILEKTKKKQNIENLKKDHSLQQNIKLRDKQVIKDQFILKQSHIISKPQSNYSQLQTMSQCLCVFKKQSKIRLNSHTINFKYTPNNNYINSYVNEIKYNNQGNVIVIEDSRCKIKSDFSKVTKQIQPASRVQFIYNTNSISTMTHKAKGTNDYINQIQTIYKARPIYNNRDTTNEKKLNIKNTSSSIIINKSICNFHSPRPLQFIPRR